MALFVCVLCQPVHSFIEPSLHGLDFVLEIFLWRLGNYRHHYDQSMHGVHRTGNHMICMLPTMSNKCIADGSRQILRFSMDLIWV